MDSPAFEMQECRRLMNRYGQERTPFIVIVDFEMQRPVILPLDECDRHGIRWRLNGNNSAACLNSPTVVMAKQPIAFTDYRRSFNLVMDRIAAGDTYLVNLTFPTGICLNMSIADVYSRSDAPFNLLSGDRWVVFSPERFVELKDGLISTYPMKGTIDAAVVDAESVLLADAKEEAEHATVVDLLRNDLSIVAEDVRLERYRYIETIVTHEKKLLQVSSKITGRLRGDWRSRLGDIVIPLLPAGSICGAPKRRTLEIIAAAERQERGFYTGTAGIFDGRDFTSFVLIRYIERIGDALFFRSGGGITHASNPEAEYREMLDKVYVPLV